MLAVVHAAPGVSHGEYANGTERWTDRRMLNRYIMLYAGCGQHNNIYHP